MAAWERQKKTDSLYDGRVKFRRISQAFSAIAIRGKPWDISSEVPVPVLE